MSNQFTAFLSSKGQFRLQYIGNIRCNSSIHHIACHNNNDFEKLIQEKEIRSLLSNENNGCQDVTFLAFPILACCQTRFLDHETGMNILILELQDHAMKSITFISNLTDEKTRKKIKLIIKDMNKA